MVVSIEQISELLDIMEANKELALGRCSRTKEGRNLAKRMWQDAASRLNCLGPSCDSKSPEEWRTFYSDYKYKLMKKIKKIKGEHSATGGGPAKKIILTILEDRLYNILGRDVGDPSPGVRKNPLSEININTQIQEGSDSNFVVLDISENKDIDEIIQMPFVEDRMLITTLNDGEEQIEDQETVPITEIETDPIQLEPINPVSQPTPQRRRPRRSATQQRLEATHLQLATDQLANIEKISADAMMEQARATNRIANALERIASAMERKEDAPARTTYKRVIIDSD